MSKTKTSSLGSLACLAIAVFGLGAVNARANAPMPTAAEVQHLWEKFGWLDLGNDWSLGKVELDMTMSRDTRGYGSPVKQGDKIVFKQERANFAISGKVYLRSCSHLLGDDKYQYRTTKVVGAPAGDGSMDPNFAGTSRLTIEKRGAKYFARVFLKAGNQTALVNQFHLMEDYEFEVAFQQGGWQELQEGKAVELHATPAGQAAYHAGVKRVVENIGATTAKVLEQKLLASPLRVQIAIATNFRDLQKFNFKNSVVIRTSKNIANGLDVEIAPFEVFYRVPAAVLNSEHNKDCNGNVRLR